MRIYDRQGMCRADTFAASLDISRAVSAFGAVRDATEGRMQGAKTARRDVSAQGLRVAHANCSLQPCQLAPDRRAPRRHATTVMGKSLRRFNECCWSSQGAMEGPARGRCEFVRAV
jgi:hypothetical protein